MTRLVTRIGLAVVTAGLAIVVVSAQTSGGAFVTGADYTVTGAWTFTQAPVFPTSGSGAPVTVNGTQTLTNKTLTAPIMTAVAITGTSTIGNGMTITTPVLSGTVTGTYTLGGTPTLASAAGVPYVAGVAAGYKVARGETALDNTNPTPVATGLTTIVACTLTIKTTAAPGVSTSVVTYDTSTSTLNMYGWKVTATGDTTLIASSGTDTIGWICVGT